VSKLIRKLAVAAAAFVCSPAVAGAADEPPPSAAPYMQPQTAVRLPDGRRVNMVCMGEGAPVVILYAGHNGWSPDWRDAQPEFAKTTRVCAVDRAGYGFSDPGPLPRDAAADVSDLYLALKASGLPGPYVLVGHSLGGLEMRLFAYRHPELVSGLLLIDPAIERSDARLFQSKGDSEKTLAYLRYCLAQARAGKIVAGEVRAGDPGPCVRAPHPRRTEEEKRRLFQVYAQPSLFEALISEFESRDGRTSDEVEADRRKLGAIPLVVLSADKAHFTAALPSTEPGRAYANWIGAHEDDARDSTRGEHRVVEGAGHWIYGDRPDAVIAAFHEVVEAATAPSGAAAVVIAPVHEAYARVEKAQAALPAPKDDREKLERLLDVDQAGRAALSAIDLSKLPPEQAKLAHDAVWREISLHDLADQAALKAMTPPQGWFTKSKYGDKAVLGAFLIVQHAVNDEAWMKDVMARVEPLVKVGEVPPGDYALLYDRTSLLDGRKQSYGTQMTCKDRRWVPADLEDPAKVDIRRKQLGMTTTEEDYLKDFADDPPCVAH